ncbi:MAG: hypothetical protein J0H68_01495 [Sphingobacteriia bacterium]|nr:hypothetical protein [Sphingobacteriia bacterium]
MQDSNNNLEKTNYIEATPLELLVYVAKYLDHKTITSNLHVSKRVIAIYNEWLKNGKIEFNQKTDINSFNDYIKNNEIEPKHISFKQIKNQPVQLAHLKSLKSLKLIHTNYESPQFAELVNLTSLMIDSENISIDNLEKLTTLKVLELTGKFSRELRFESFKEFPDLEELTINIKNIYSFFLATRFTLNQLPNPFKLRKLQLSNVIIEEKASVTLNLFNNLKDLHFSNVEIRELSFENLSNLKTLTLHKCKFSNWQALGSCINLKKLVLDGTKLNDISQLPVMNKVKELHLIDNEITSNLQLLAKKFPNLTTLSLQGVGYGIVKYPLLSRNASFTAGIGKTRISNFYKLPTFSSVKNLILFNHNMNDENDTKETLETKFPNLTSLNYEVTSSVKQLKAIEGLSKLEFLVLDLSNVTFLSKQNESLLKLDNLKEIKVILSKHSKDIKMPARELESLGVILAMLKIKNVIIDLSEVKSGKYKELLEKIIDEKVEELKPQENKGFRSGIEKEEKQTCLIL